MSKSKSKGRVLIVEDDPDLNEAFKIVLSKEGYDVLTAFNGQEALGFLEEDEPNPDIILLDLLMPVMSGEEFLREINDSGYKIPVVVFTNLDAQNDIAEVQRLGTQRYILKAWASPNDLVKIVKDTLSKKS